MLQWKQSHIKSSRFHAIKCLDRNQTVITSAYFNKTASSLEARDSNKTRLQEFYSFSSTMYVAALHDYFF